jgi:hypothetical protein
MQALTGSMTARSDVLDNPLIGTWKLLSYQLVGSRGRIRYPYGEDAIGYILYGPDGYMAVSIMSAERQPFAGTDILRRTTEEAAAATRTYLSYCGRYQLFPDRVVHHVDVSLFPNWTGTMQERYYRLDGDILELSTAPKLLEGKEPRAYLVWKRYDPGHFADGDET